MVALGPHHQGLPNSGSHSASDGSGPLHSNSTLRCTSDRPAATKFPQKVKHHINTFCALLSSLKSIKWKNWGSLSVVDLLTGTFSHVQNPPFTSLHWAQWSVEQWYDHGSRHCVWPRISHIWHLSSPPLYPSGRLPTTPPIIQSWHWSKMSSFQKTGQNKSDAARPFYSSWLKGLT